MNTDWALTELRQFVGMTELYRPPDPPGIAVFADSRRTKATKSEIIPVAQVVEQILDRVLPDWRSALEPDAKGRWQQHREAALRAIVQIERQAEIDEKLGDAAPKLSAASMHPWVWDAARSLWQSRHYSDAVRAASVKVNAETQNKVGTRELSETKLFQQVFRNEPGKSAIAMLRLPGDDGGTTAASVRRGVMAFAEGCYAALRNPISHDQQSELAEAEALEQLSAFSLLARWVDSSGVEAVPKV